MDAFYASVEQRDNPALRGKPVVVGGSGMRGVVASASYEARRYGVRSAMPSVVAQRLCPEIIFTKSRFDVYKDVSRQIRDIFYEYADLVEPLSLDEAYLDVTTDKMGIGSATLVAKAILKRILETTQLTASAGVSFNKFLAKVASGVNKPNGIKVITPDEAPRFLEQLPIEKFHGIGTATAKKMKALGIHNGADLKQRSEADLAQYFGKAGQHYYRIVRADDRREVNPNRIRKSIGAERTFFEDLSDLEVMKEKLAHITGIVHEYMLKHDNFGRTVTLKIKSSDFRQITRSKTFSSEPHDLEVLIATVNELLELNRQEVEKVRLLGVTVSNLARERSSEGIQLSFEF